MIHFNQEIQDLNNQYKDKKVSIEYRENDEFAKQATISIKADYYFEAISVLFVNGEYTLFSESKVFSHFESKSIPDIVSEVEKRVKYGISITQTKSESVSHEDIIKVSEKYQLDIEMLHGSTVVNHAGYRVLCNVFQEIIFLNIGFKTIKIPFARAKEILSSLSDFEMVN